jgi:hypothetical protein
MFSTVVRYVRHNSEPAGRGLIAVADRDQKLGQYWQSTSSKLLVVVLIDHVTMSAMRRSDFFFVLSGS